MYKPLQKKSSSWTTASIQKKSKNFSKPSSSAVPASRDAKSPESQEMPSYSKAAADLLAENVMRGMETQEPSEVETSTVQRQSPLGGAAGAAVAPPILSIPTVQTKLTIGKPGDVYEQEADRMAQQVMSMPRAAAAPPQVQRFGVEDSPVGMYSSLVRSITPVVHRRVDEQVQMYSPVQRAFQAGGTQASGDLESRLNASKGGGSALAPEVRAFMEPRFGADFSSVRVHTGNDAVQMNRELSAQAFAHGSDVYFGAGKSPGNNELTAHELTHVVQQTGGVQRKIGDGHDLTSPRFAGDPVLEACFDNEKLLMVGSSGSAVEKLQQALIDAGFPLPKYGADGKFGSETKAAVKDFQTDSGFTGKDVDGIVGSKTMGALDAHFGAAPPETTPPETTPPETTPPETTPPETTPPETTPPETDENAKKKEEAKKILDEDASGSWVNLSWDKVKDGAKKRIEDPHSIDQKNLNVCGPAVIVNALADTDPVQYAKFVRTVFTTAKVNGTQVDDDLLNGRPSSGMEDVDWMILSAMRDTENAIFDYEGTEEEDFSAMTMPGEIAEWMEEILGCVDTTHYTSYSWGEIDNSEKVNSLLEAHGNKVIVSMLVNASRLEGKDDGLDIPDHWIRLLTPITITDDTVSFKVFTWGKSEVKTFKRDNSDGVDFEDVIFEFVVGAKEKNIDL
jgi:hypothetical protein